MVTTPTRQRPEVAAPSVRRVLSTRPGVDVTRPSAEETYSNGYSNGLRMAANLDEQR
jgi:hypothetical protein